MGDSPTNALYLKLIAQVEEALAEIKKLAPTVLEVTAATEAQTAATEASTAADEEKLSITQLLQLANEQNRVDEIELAKEIEAGNKAREKAIAEIERSRDAVLNHNQQIQSEAELQRALAAQVERLGEIQRKEVQDFVRGVQEKRQAIQAQNAAVEQEVKLQQMLGEQSQRVAQLQGQEVRTVVQGMEQKRQAILEQNAATEQQLQLQKMLADQEARLGELQGERAGRTEVAAVVQGMEEERSAIQARNSAVQEGQQNFQQMLPILSDLRQVVRLAFGVTALVYFTEHIKDVVLSIQDASLALRGFDATAKQLMADTAAMNQRLLDQTGKLTDAQLAHLKTLHDIKQVEQEQAQAKIAETNASILQDKQQIDALEERKKKLKEIDQLSNESLYNPARQAADIVRIRQLENELGIVGTIVDINKELLEAQKQIDALGEKQLGHHYQLNELELEAYKKTLERNKSTRDWVDNLAEALPLIRQTTEELTKEAEALEAGQVGASKKAQAQLEFDRQAASYKKMLDNDLASHKLNAAQRAELERNYTEIIVALRTQLAARLRVIGDQEEIEAEKKLATQLAAQQRHDEQMRKEMENHLNSYINSLQRETEADLKAADTKHIITVRGIQLRAQDTADATMRAAQQERIAAMMAGDYARAAQVIWVAQQRIAAGWVKASADETAAVNKMIASGEQLSFRLTTSFTRLNTPLGSHVAALNQSIRAIQEYSSRVQSAAVHMRTEAAALREDEKGHEGTTRAIMDEYNALRLLTEATDLEAKAKQQVRQAEEDAAASAVAGFAGVIAGKRAQAAVEGAFDTAKAIQMWARFAASWGTDGGAALAAAQYTVSAAEMFKVAGSGGGGGGTSGGGGSGSGRSGSSGAGGNISGAALTPAQQAALLAPGTAAALQGPTGNIRVMVLPESTAAQHIANIINKATTTRDLRLVASHVINPAPASRGRS